ncbi:hypothetical protein HYV49_04140 [Candidatus Pacearchaeota archaeon]|nr:hypothetical protein [Candidatus Pacearchaeota archaeon]
MYTIQKITYIIEDSLKEIMFPFKEKIVGADVEAENPIELTIKLISRTEKEIIAELTPNQNILRFYLISDDNSKVKLFIERSKDKKIKRQYLQYLSNEILITLILTFHP